MLKIGENSNQTHPRFKRRYKDNKIGFTIHAEMNVLRFARPGDVIVVMRWSKHGELTMSKPCEHCERFMKEAGIKEVLYSNWNGGFSKLKF